MENRKTTKIQLSNVFSLLLLLFLQRLLTDKKFLLIKPVFEEKVITTKENNIREPFAGSGTVFVFLSFCLSFFFFLFFLKAFNI